jgi:excisionase family DNA binding protein
MISICIINFEAVLQLANLQNGEGMTAMPRKKPSLPAQEAETPTALDAKDEELLTTREVARRLKVTPQTVQRLIHRGDLVASRVARDWRIKPSELEAFLQRTQSR